MAPRNCASTLQSDVFQSFGPNLAPKDADQAGSHDAARREEAAAAALNAGSVVVLPTETVYGLFVRASHVSALGRVRSGGSGGPSSPVTWHAAGVQHVVEALHLRTPVHLHVLRTLAPGPVRFLIEVSDETASAICAKHPDLPVFASAPATFSVRIPDHPLCARVLALVPHVVVADRAAGIDLCDPAYADGVALRTDVAARAAALGVASVLDNGPTRLRTGSTTIRLTRDGWWRFESAGALSEPVIRARLETSVLFVCTGNTCRSPMAEAVARHLLAKPGVRMKPTRVASAGVSAFGDDAMTPEAREALKGLGIDAAAHRSQALTRDLLRDSDVIYVMTNAHARRVLELFPDARDKLHTLDPSGRDIADPIGGTLADYRTSAQQIAHLVEQRLESLGLILPPHRKGVLESW